MVLVEGLSEQLARYVQGAEQPDVYLLGEYMQVRRARRRPRRSWRLRRETRRLCQRQVSHTRRRLCRPWQSHRSIRQLRC